MNNITAVSQFTQSTQSTQSILMEDVLTEIPGIYDRKLIVPYTVIPFEDIVALIPKQTEEL